MKLTPDLPQKIMKKIRLQYKEGTLPSWDPDRCHIYYEDAWMEPNIPYILPLVIMKTHTCSWLKIGGGCTMCNYQYISSFNKKITNDNILNQVKWALDKLSPLKRFPYIHLTSSGSFMDPNEINDDVLIKILELLNKSEIKILSTESRPEFLLNNERLKIIRERFDGEVTFGLGLEAYDDFIRTYCINKGNTLKDYINAIKNLKKYGFGFHTYILLGKPFLTIKEDITDAVKGIKFTIDNGGVSILMVANHQPYTLLDWLYNRNKYQFPCLWSSIEILKLLNSEERNKVWIKGIDKGVPIPSYFSKTCPRCTSFVHNAIVGWNYTRNFSLIERITDCCECVKDWHFNYNKSTNTPLTERIKSEYKYINNKLNMNKGEQ